MRRLTRSSSRQPGGRAGAFSGAAPIRAAAGGASRRGAPLIALDTTGPRLDEAPFPERFGLVVGAEGRGLPEHLRQGERRRIAIEPGVESLNAATAAAIALYAWARRRQESS